MQVVRNGIARRGMAMLQSLFCLVLLASPLMAQSQIAVLTSDVRFTPRWETVPRPDKPVYANRFNGFSFDTRPAGTYEIAYHLVDEQWQLSPRSPSVKASPAVYDWEVVASTPNLPKDTRATGTLWVYRKVDDAIWKVLGANLNAGQPSDAIRPFVPLVGWDHSLGGFYLGNVRGWPYLSDVAYWKITSQLPAPPTPAVRVYSCKNVACEAAIAWACNDGETPLSDPVSIPAFVHPAGVPSPPQWHCPIVLFCNQIPPQGALGKYLYLREPGGVWQRQPAPATIDGYLWPLEANKMTVRDFLPGPQPGQGPGRSWLSSIHLAMRDTNRDVVVDSDQEICCPIIGPYDGTTGQKFWRTIATSNGGMWRLRDRWEGAPDGKTNYPRGWPLWVENSIKTRVVGCNIDLYQSQCGFCFLDHRGGAAQGFQGERLIVQKNGMNTLPTYGIRVVGHSRGPAWNDHSASEVSLTDCLFATKFPVIVEGQQSANWLIDKLHAGSDGSGDSAILTLGNSGSIQFTGQLACDNARTIIAYTTTGRATVQNLFVDQGFPAWVTVSGNCNAQLTVTGSKINHWAKWLHVVEAPSGSAGAIGITLSDVTSQGLTQSWLCSPKQGAITVLASPTLPLLEKIQQSVPVQ